MLSFFNKLYSKYFGDTHYLQLPPGETEFDYIPLEEVKIKKKIPIKKLPNVETKIYNSSKYEVSKDGN